MIAAPSRRRPAQGRRALLTIVVPWALAACRVQVTSEGYLARETRRFSVSGTPEVRLVTFAGALDVRGVDEDGVELVVEIEKRAGARELLEAMELHAEADEQAVHLEARRPARGPTFIPLGGVGSPRVDLAATLPRHVRLYAQTGDGSIKAERLAGRLELRLGEGRVRGADLSGEVFVHSGEGSIDLQGVDGRLVASTGDGAIVARGRLEQVSLRSGDGSVQLRVEPGSAMTADWQIVTGTGGIVVYLPVPFDAEIDAVTGDGAIRVEGALPLEGVSSDRRSLRATLGAGGHRLRLWSGEGSIRVRTW